MGGVDDNMLAYIAKGLGIGADVLKKLLGEPDLGTRGNVGGEGQLQRSDQSMSDQLRSYYESGGPLPSMDISAPGPLSGEITGLPQQQLSSPTSSEFGTQLPGTLGTASEYFSSPEGIAALGELGINTDLLGGAGEGLGGVGGGMGLGGGISLAGGALGLLGGLTDDKGVAMLAKAVGGIGQLTSLVGPIAQAAASGSAVAMQAATAAAAAAAPAAVVAAVIQMGLAIANGIQAGNPPEQITLDTLAAPDFIASNIMSELIDPMFHPSESWMTFPERVGKTAQLEGSSLGALMKGLPYVQSKQELADALNAFKVEVGHRVGGYGEGAGQYQIPNLPGVGPKTHGVNTSETDFGPHVRNAQQIIDALLPLLPDTYASTDNSEMRNFARFQNPDYATPQMMYDPGQFGEHAAMFQQLYGTTMPLIGGMVMVPNAGPVPEGYTGRPGGPGYDYSVPGAYPDPNAPITTPKSAAWLRLSGATPAQAQAPAAAPGAAPADTRMDSLTQALRTALLGTPGGVESVPQAPQGSPSLGGSEDMTEAIRRRIAGMA
jgi:hypothetical protein